MARIFRQLVAVFFLCLMICSCASRKDVKYKYAKKPFDLDSSYRAADSRSDKQLPHLDLDTYYYHYDSNRTVFSLEGNYHILKFYNDGRVQAVSDKTLSGRNLKSTPSLTHKDINYYKVEDETIKMEFWRDKMARMGYWKGVVYSDSIVFEKVNNVLDKTVYLRKK